MLEFSIGLLKDVIDIVCKNKEMRNDTKLRIAILLEEISKILEDTAIKLSKDEYPHMNCYILEKMSNNLHFHLIDIIPEDQLDEIHNSLIESSKIEKQFSLRKEPETIPSIFKSAAEFKSLSLILKI